MLNNKGRPTQPTAVSEMDAVTETFTGNKGLDLESPLIFEQGVPGRTGVDMADPQPVKSRLGGLERKEPIGLPDALLKLGGTYRDRSRLHHARLQPRALRP